MASGVIVKVTLSVVDPELVIVWRISPVPEGANPVTFGELATAVQFNVVPVTDDVSRISVVSPEQMEGEEEVIMTSGMGYTVTV